MDQTHLLRNIDRDHSRELAVNWRIILKDILNRTGGHGLDPSVTDYRQGPLERTGCKLEDNIKSDLE